MLQNLLSNLGLQNFDPVELLIRVFVIVISLSFHEASHAYRAYRLGDDTAERAGRLTLNPLAHLDPLGTLMMFIAKVGWAKPVPINPVRFTRAKTMKRGIVEVSLAGPLSNIVLSFAAFFIYRLMLFVIPSGTATAGTGSIASVFLLIFLMMFQLNIYLAVFNLFPVPPLDGFKIFGSLLPGKAYYQLMNYERYIGIAFIFLIIFGGNVFGQILYTVATPVFYLIQLPINGLFTLLGLLF